MSLQYFCHDSLLANLISLFTTASQLLNSIKLGRVGCLCSPFLAEIFCFNREAHFSVHQGLQHLTVTISLVYFNVLSLVLTILATNKSEFSSTLTKFLKSGGLGKLCCQVGQDPLSNFHLSLVLILAMHGLTANCNYSMDWVVITTSILVNFNL